MNPITEIFKTQSMIVLDGALATELERRGANLNDALWSAKVLLEQPELIEAVHTDYFLAGADCATTASYQASVSGFMQRGLNEKQAWQLIKKSVELATQARNNFWAKAENRVGRAKPFVAGSVGPYGAYLANGAEYTGEYSLNKKGLQDFHRPRMQALLEAGADVLAMETIPSLLEAEALAELLQEFSAACAWLSFSAKDETSNCHGEKISECAALLNQYPQIVAVGINCTAPKFIPSLVKEIKTSTQKPIAVYPNSGEVYDPKTHAWHGETSCTNFAAQAKTWFAAGANIVGGCCRTTPEHVASLRELV